MSEDYIECSVELSELLGHIRRANEIAARVRTEYLYYEKNDPIEKKCIYRKKWGIMKKILGELVILQDTSTLSSVKLKKLMEELEKEEE